MREKIDIIEKRQKDRKEKIELIEVALKIYMKKQGRYNLTISYKGIVMGIESHFNCTTRKAKEYLEVALYKVGLVASDLLPQHRNHLETRFQLIENHEEFKRGLD